MPADISTESWFFKSVMLPKLYELAGSDQRWKTFLNNIRLAIEIDIPRNYATRPPQSAGRAKKSAIKMLRHFEDYHPGQVIQPPIEEDEKDENPPVQSSPPPPPPEFPLSAAVQASPRPKFPFLDPWLDLPAANPFDAELDAALQEAIENEPQARPKSWIESALESVAEKMEVPFQKEGKDGGPRLPRLFWAKLPPHNGRAMAIVMTARYLYGGKEHNINGKVNGQVFRKCGEDRVYFENGHKVEVAKTFRAMVNDQEAVGTMWFSVVFIDEVAPVFLWHNVDNGLGSGDTRKIRLYLTNGEIAFKEEKV